MHLDAVASGNSQIYQAGRDQYIVGRDLHLRFESGAYRVYRAVPGVAECPYPGLAEFGPEQGHWYFGRDRLIDELLRRLDERRSRGGPLVVVAPSGAGKSSLLRAGLLTALAEGRLEGSSGSAALLFTPTDQPLVELARKLATVVGIEPARLTGLLSSDPDTAAALLREALRVRGGQYGPPARVVLIVDQLEELFTACTDEHERRLFVGALAHLAAPGPDGQPPTALVVYGLRADFYASCTRYPVLRAALEDGQILVGPMSRDELRAAIQDPARLVGLDVEEGLVELLLADLGGDVPGPGGPGGGHHRRSDHEDDGDYEAGRLPLLAHALRATWQQRHGSVLTVAAYQVSGGIREAVARTAEDVFGSLDEAGRQAARALFGQLVNIGGEGVDNTRRRVDRANLLGAADGGAMWTVVDAFTRGRLLTQDQKTVGITHEALLRSWPRLQEWINSDRAGNLTRQELDEAAAAWDRTGRESSRLYRGSRLETARRWAAAYDGELVRATHDFLATSVQAHRRSAWIRRGTAVALIVLSVLTSAAAVVAARGAGTARTARDSARAARDTAVFNQVTAEADQVRDTDTSLAAQLDLTAYRMHPTPELRTKLLASQNTPLATAFAASTGLVRSVAVSHDGHTLATGDQDGAVRLWDITDPARPLPRGRPLRADHGPATSLAFSHDSRVLASTGMGSVQLWSLEDLSRPRELGRLAGHVGVVATVALSLDGHTAASAGEDGAVRLWDVTDPARPRARGGPLTGQGPAVFAAAFSPDGHTLATVDNAARLRLWNVANPDHPVAAGVPPPAGHTGPVLSVAFSPDGRTLATGSQDRTVRLWNVSDPAHPALLGNLTGHNSYVWSVAFSPDGRTLASASYDHNVLLWNVSDPNHPAALGRALTGHTGPVTSVAFGPDGRTLVTGSHDHTVRLWDLPATILSGHTGGVEAVAFSPDGRTLASASDDRTVRLWNVRDVAHPTALGGPLTGFNGLVNTVAFSPDGRTLAAGSQDRAIRLWNVADPIRPTPLGTLTGHAGYVWSVAFSPDGHTLASGDDKGALRLWNVTDPAHPTLVSTVTRHTASVNSVAFSPDGRRLATGSGDRTVLLWDLGDLPPSPVGAPLDAHTGPTWSVAWSRDGHTLASASEDGTIRLWNVTDPAHASTLGAPLNAHTNTVYSLAFSPDQRTLASAGQDSTVRLWNIADPAHPVSLGPPLNQNANTVFAVTFSPDGRTLASASADRTVLLWATDTGRAVRRICSTARHILTPQQWKKYVPQLPYTPPCS